MNVLFIHNYIFLFCKQNTLGHTSLTILRNNSSSLRVLVLELKDKINSGTLNHITCASTQSEEEAWIKGASMLFGFAQKDSHED